MSTMCVSIIKERFFESSAAGKPPEEVICERLLVDPRENNERWDKALKIKMSTRMFNKDKERLLVDPRENNEGWDKALKIRTIMRMYNKDKERIALGRSEGEQREMR